MPLWVEPARGRMPAALAIGISTVTISRTYWSGRNDISRRSESLEQCYGAIRLLTGAHRRASR